MEQTIAVIGAGTMGPGMAAVFARAGHRVQLMDSAPAALERARGAVGQVLRVWEDQSALREGEARAIAERIAFGTDLAAAVRSAWFVLEAVPEQLELKRRVFAQLEAAEGPQAILATNTSGIPITQIQEGLRCPGRVAGMHWSNPPHVIPVIEVIRGERTDAATIEAIARLAHEIGMIPVRVQRDVPGFVENRILYAIIREALDLLERGVATAGEIDTVVRWGIGMKLAVIGPLALLDVAGLDIYHSVASYLNPDLSARKDVSPLIRERVEQGQLGIKTGRGLGEYSQEQIPALAEQRGRLLLQVRKALMGGGNVGEGPGVLRR